MIAHGKKYITQPIGQILLHGGFISQHDLDLALEEQKHTKERLGEALVRMGIVDRGDIKAVLVVQGYLHLGRLEDAMRVAAGVGKEIGELLIHSGRITEQQLAQAIGEQLRSGEKLGNVLLRIGLFTEEQLSGLLHLQRIQDETIHSPGPLSLGEILVTTGSITRDRLDKALEKQVRVRKKLEEVLIEEGYARPEHVKHGLHLQEKLLAAALAALLTACGAAGPVDYPAPSGSATTDQSEDAASSNYFIISSADYDILKPNYYYSTNNEKFWSFQAAVARNVWDEEYKCVARVDIQKSDDGEMPAINKTFSIEKNGPYEQFPGTFVLFNGEKSVYKSVESGVISFSPDSDASGRINGSFEVIVVDYDSASVPAPRYKLTGSFWFTMGSFGPASPLPVS